MIDHWRNHSLITWHWYSQGFPINLDDGGEPTHAHFDHDALNCLDANVLLDRLIEMYKFGDMAIQGLADIHAVDTSCAIYNF